MRVTAPRQSLLDTISELVATKAGLLLTQGKLLEILVEKSSDVDNSFFILGGSSQWWKGDPNQFVSVRAEEIEADFIVVMHAVGAIPDQKNPTRLVVDFAKTHIDTLSSLITPSEFRLPPVVELSSVLQSAIASFCFAGDPLPTELESLHAFQVLLRNYRQRYIMDNSMPEVRSWNGVLSLNDLFESEVIPKETKEAHYFDQRYINYLASRTAELYQMHWRQFEYLTAEYFERNGYSTTITDARKDGGFDIVVRREDANLGPDCILVQCRRYAENNPVDLDSVKSFWSTVTDEGATKGLIACTSRLTRDARNWCERQARQYRLHSAEKDHVVGWLSSLKLVE